MTLNLRDDIRNALLNFVDQCVPGVTESVWLTGSRVRGNARSDSDWDLVAFTKAINPDPKVLFVSNQISSYTLEGGRIELVIAHPDHWADERRYMTELRATGIQLRGQFDNEVGHFRP